MLIRCLYAQRRKTAATGVPGLPRRNAQRRSRVNWLNYTTWALAPTTDKSVRRTVAAYQPESRANSLARENGEDDYRQRHKPQYSSIANNMRI